MAARFVVFVDDFNDFAVDRHPVIRVLGVHQQKRYLAVAAQIAILQTPAHGVEFQPRSIIAHPYGRDLHFFLVIDRG